MATGPEEIKTRLENIHAIEPLLAALRTISLSNWRFALNKIEVAKQYLEQLQSIYSQFPASDSGKNNLPTAKKQLLILIGSNRGLCSNFNRDLLRHLSLFLSETIVETRLIVIGERLRKTLERRKIQYHEFLPFPNTVNLNPSFSQDLFNQHITTHLDGHVELLFNLYRGAGQYRTTRSSVFPNTFMNLSIRNFPIEEYIFDTNPDEIQTYLFDHLYQLTIYFALLSSAASEHSTRFQLMESASSNAQRLAEELFIEVQVQRRQKITSEMQELAIGAGLLKKAEAQTPPSGSQKF
jgi:F-type H+-transporting ATPase subunit gamma